ncbi:MAG: flagellar biosynthesis repressor FlbT [Alphaproteobacteria bacterium]
MPLKLSLSKGEKLIVNGAVIKNDGTDASLVFENQAHILRQKDILTMEDATTPASRVYLALQCAYMFPENASRHLDDFRQLASEFASAAPSSVKIVETMFDHADQGQLYNALKACRELIDYEAGVLADA